MLLSDDDAGHCTTKFNLLLRPAAQECRWLIDIVAHAYVHCPTDSLLNDKTDALAQHSTAQHTHTHARSHTILCDGHAVGAASRYADDEAILEGAHKLRRAVTLCVAETELACEKKGTSPVEKKATS